MYYYPQDNRGYQQNYQQGYQQQGYQQVNQQVNQQGYQQNMTQQIILQGYPVPDEATARNAEVNTNGTISIFPDIQHGKIYTKQLDMNTFAPIFKIYQLVEQQQGGTSYVCLEDFQRLQNYVSNLEMKINEMINLPKITDKKGVDKNVQSNANDRK